ncbi:hypothetical protein CRENBAI_020957 [Crenichthys baileyi]|uniref:Carboxylic ester hydrolase n=1 Tax=Crenichthys baileyi TaxID=28760 RepID=A0AAV9RIG2_9TELE
MFYWSEQRARELAERCEKGAAWDDHGARKILGPSCLGGDTKTHTVFERSPGKDAVSQSGRKTAETASPWLRLSLLPGTSSSLHLQDLGWRFPMATAFHAVNLLLLLPILTASFATQDDLVISTTYGKVQGKLLSVPNGEVRAFLGIPYAKPPLGTLRFHAPEPVEKWEGVKEAKKLPNSCYQLPDTTYPGFKGAEMWNPNTPLSEDCLYLNVWSPNFNKTKSPTLAPVLVWIYGGGFVTGTSSLDLYQAHFLSKAEGVVVVSMNYRVGAFGFLSLPDNKNIQGNAGLLDQRLALKWVANNIAAFGGDPSKVTIFGESAGSASVGFHLLSPGSHSLFQRAVMQSGSPNAPWATITQSEVMLNGSNLPKKELMIGLNKDEGTFLLPYGMPGFSNTGQSLISRNDFLKVWMGVMHGYEIEFVFGMPLNASLGYTNNERNMTKKFMKHWANFARTGNPGLDGVAWPVFTAERQEYITLNYNLPEQKRMMRAKECHLWKKLLPPIQKTSG